MRSVRHSKKSPSFIGSRNSEDLVGLNGKDLYAPPRRAATGRLDRAEKKRLLQSIRRLREVSQLLSRIFAERRHSDQIDLEAVENAFRTALHQAGAAGLTELLQYEAPAPQQRQLPCSCGHHAQYQALRSKPVLSVLGPARAFHDRITCVRNAITDSFPPTPNWTWRTRKSPRACAE